MKILIVGELSERQHRMLRERWAHVPEAELIFVKHEEFYQEPEPDSEPQTMWIDEVSDFVTASEILAPEWFPNVQFLNAISPDTNWPKKSPKTGWKAIRQEKTAPVWTRRKKR